LLAGRDHHHRLVVCAILALGIATSSFAQETQGRLRGTVTSSAGAVEGANVVVIGTLFGGVTDGNGTFAIESVPPGSYVVQITLAGFRDYRLEVDVRAGEVTELAIRLRPSDVELGTSRTHTGPETPFASFWDGHRVDRLEFAGVEGRVVRPGWSFARRGAMANIVVDRYGNAAGIYDELGVVESQSDPLTLSPPEILGAAGEYLYPEPELDGLLEGRVATTAASTSSSETDGDTTRRGRVRMGWSSNTGNREVDGIIRGAESSVTYFLSAGLSASSDYKDGSGSTVAASTAFGRGRGGVTVRLSPYSAVALLVAGVKAGRSSIPGGFLDADEATWWKAGLRFRFLRPSGRLRNADIRIVREVGSELLVARGPARVLPLRQLQQGDVLDVGRHRTVADALASVSVASGIEVFARFVASLEDLAVEQGSTDASGELDRVAGAVGIQYVTGRTRLRGGLRTGRATYQAMSFEPGRDRMWLSSAGVEATWQPSENSVGGVGFGTIGHVADLADRYGFGAPTWSAQRPGLSAGGIDLRTLRALSANVFGFAESGTTRLLAAVSVRHEPRRLERVPDVEDGVRAVITESRRMTAMVGVRDVRKTVEFGALAVYTRGRNLTFDASALGTPSPAARLFGRAQVPGNLLYVYGNVDIMLKQDRVDELRREVRTPGVTTVDFGFGADVGRADVAIEIANLGGATYAYHLSAISADTDAQVTEPGRSFRFRLGVEF
jgi:hypothetical protein